jgi:hypothetical protein
MSSQPTGAPMNFVPQTFSTVLNAPRMLSDQQVAIGQHFQQMHSLLMAQRQLHMQNQQLQQQHLPPAASDQTNGSAYVAQPGSFPRFPAAPQSMFSGMDRCGGIEPCNLPVRIGGETLASAAMRANPVPLPNMAAWHQLYAGGVHSGSSPLVEGMLKSWSQGLLEASKNAAHSAFGAHDVGGMAAHSFFASQGPPRKLKKAAAAAIGGDKKPKQPKQVLNGTAAAKPDADNDAERSALDVLSAAVDVQGGDRDEASLNAANALHALHGGDGWHGGGDACVAGMPVTPRLSKKRNRSLLKDLAVSVVDTADDDGVTLTPCSKGRSSKQLDSAYNHNTNPEHVCRTKDGAPVVDVHVPAMCECGSVVVGVWYRNRPHYCRWFRHARYSALRALLEQNRRKNKSRPYDETGGCDAPGSAANDSSVSGGAVAGVAASVPASDESAPECPAEPSLLGSKTSAEELLAPKFLSLLCLFQFVKHDDAVELVYPRGILGNTMSKPQSLKISMF